MPHIFRVVSEAAGAVRWALPREHPASSDPRLLDLIDDLRLISEDLLRRFIRAEPDGTNRPVPYDQFIQSREEPSKASDARLNRFLELEAWLRSLTKAEADAPQTLYQRYSAWLAFAQSSEAFFDAAARDLAYEVAGSIARANGRAGIQERAG